MGREGGVSLSHVGITLEAVMARVVYAVLRFVSLPPFQSRPPLGVYFATLDTSYYIVSCHRQYIANISRLTA